MHAACVGFAPARRQVLVIEGKKRDVAQLGAQSKQPISPLQATTDKGSASAANTDDLSYRAKFAAEVGMSLSQLDAEELPPICM